MPTEARIDGVDICSSVSSAWAGWAGNIARRLQRAGHEIVVFDVSKEAVEKLSGEGMTGSSSLDDLRTKLKAPRSIWVMLPSGKITEDTILDLGEHLEEGDTIIDGGNTFYKDDIRRAQQLQKKGLHYVDVGTSGGVWGLERGYCMMIGRPTRRRSSASTRSSRRWRRARATSSRRAAVRTSIAAQRRVTCTAGRLARAIS